MNVAGITKRFDRSQVVVIGVAAAMLGCFIGLICVPDHQAEVRVGAELAEARKQLADKMLEINALPEVAKKVGGLKLKHAQHLARVPADPRLPEFLGVVANILKEEKGVTQIELVPQKPKATPTYCELPISIGFESSYVSVFRTLMQLESLTRVNHVRSLSLKAIPQGKGRVQVKMEVTVYNGNAESKTSASVRADGRAAAI